MIPPERMLTAIMPAHDEAEGIEVAVREALEVLAELVTEFELIVVDDRSSDATGSILDSLARAEPRLIVLHLVGREGGYGVALRRAFQRARYPWVFFTDSDRQFDIRELPRLFEPAEHADLIVGYREIRAEGWRRLATSRTYNQIARMALGISTRDVNCAFKLVRRDLLDQLELSAEHYCINAELIAAAAQRGARIREVGVTHRPRAIGESKVGLSDVAIALRELGRVRARHARRARG
jgi:glycosyltransferase involved in cell wall biosynthesis